MSKPKIHQPIPSGSKIPMAQFVGSLPAGNFAQPVPLANLNQAIQQQLNSNSGSTPKK